jgi:transcriptional regulator with XRE-family HTH domain
MAKARKGFAAKLKAAREAAGMTPKELVKRSRISKQTISALELGVRQPSWGAVQKLAKALGVSCEHFLD